MRDSDIADFPLFSRCFNRSMRCRNKELCEKEVKETASPPGEILSPSNQSEGLQPPRLFQPAKGIAIPSATVEPTTGVEPGTSSFRGGRFAHRDCATWTPCHDCLDILLVTSVSMPSDRKP